MKKLVIVITFLSVFFISGCENHEMIKEIVLSKTESSQLESKTENNEVESKKESNAKSSQAESKDSSELFYFKEELQENVPLTPAILSDHDFNRLKNDCFNHLFDTVAVSPNMVPSWPNFFEKHMTFHVRRCENPVLDYYGELVPNVSMFYLVVQKKDTNDKLFLFGRWEISDSRWIQTYLLSGLVLFENNKFTSDGHPVGFEYEEAINLLDL